MASPGVHASPALRVLTDLEYSNWKSGKKTIKFKSDDYLNIKDPETCRYGVETQTHRISQQVRDGDHKTNRVSISVDISFNSVGAVCVKSLLLVIRYI